jgi:succinyl-CoA synthetase beta subunit
MMELFTQNDATLVEINPLAVSKKGLVALDAKITLDDSAEFRHADLWPQLLQEHMEFVFAKQSKAERLARERRITYVPSQGNIGIIADGAGTGMYGFDIVSELGGKPANFCELGIGTSERMQNAIEVVLSNPRVEVLFITLIGGLTRMDEMADGIVGYLREKNVDLPVVVRMCGTQQEIGRAKLGTAGIDALDDLLLAAKRTVELSQRH